METAEQKLQPIVNGSFNHELTNDEIFERFDFEMKRSIAWNIIVDLTSSYCPFRYEEVEYSLHQQQKFSYSYQDITPENVNTVIAQAREHLRMYKEVLTADTAKLHRQQGAEIFKMQKALKFGGTLELSHNKLIGYLKEGGDWNGFENARVSQGIIALEAAVPKFYMRNNPNNGKHEHTWTVSGPWITMKFNYLSGENEKAKYLDFYKRHWQTWKNMIKADSCRYELTEHEGGYGSFSLEFIYWWD